MVWFLDIFVIDLMMEFFIGKVGMGMMEVCKLMCDKLFEDFFYYLV